MISNYEPQLNWICPQGTHTGTCVEIKDSNKIDGRTGERFLRVVWQIDGLSDECQTVMAGKNYPKSLDADKPLGKDIASWLGPDFIEANSTKGVFDLQSLKGKKAKLRVKHHFNRFHHKPYVAVISYNVNNFPLRKNTFCIAGLTACMRPRINIWPLAFL